ncbi:ABC transporter permease [Oculatella sp. FACHB-28]|uniref:ABC transporter permease n=1 Tax=Oculatella sp. FACHB-28 TaxID=2692845 RepID=UPI001688458D|nr:ABC transporter permease [Oculatella sp. FACHB-28]MBD2059292.1 ABC transporter permease [Oculatella sp. FACHB-28]
MASSRYIKKSLRRDQVHQIQYIYDLIRELVGRDIKLQYKRSMLGIAWSFVTPLMQLVVYYFIFRLVLSLDIPNYAAFAFSGMLVWTWFQASLFRGASSITDGRELIRQPGFPVAILPIVAVTTNLVNFLLSLPILLLFLGNEGGWLKPAFALLPILILIQFLLTLSLTYLVAAINVTFRDTQHILGVLLNLVFYLTPIFYDTDTIPAQYLQTFHLNPMTYLIEAYRTVLLEGALPGLLPLLFLALMSLGLLFGTYRIFRRASYRFAEEL